MKKYFAIIAFLSMLLLSCAKQPKPVVVPKPFPFAISDTLMQIDTLLQSRPDSALQKLLSLQEQQGTSLDSHVIFNNSYQTLLTSEALYKTFNPQYYRSDLQNAMHYFDSLAIQHPDNDDVAMLSARAHYMNGVGHYENDSVVDACKEYLKTLEIMDDHFGVETSQGTALQGYKAKFMGLTYGRLGELFSSQFIMEPAIYCTKKLLFYCNIFPTSKYGVSNALYHIGQYYDILRQTDSAYYYYNLALESLPDSNNVVYRNIVTNKVLLSYILGMSAEKSLYELNEIINQTDDADEKLTRFIPVGFIYYKEKAYDSAVIYLENVFENRSDNMARFKPAEYLRNIYYEHGDTVEASKYSAFIANISTQQYDNMLEVSMLDDIFYDHVKHHQNKISKKEENKTAIALIVAVLVCISMVFMIKRIKTNKITKEKQKHDLKLEEEILQLKKNCYDNDGMRFEALQKIAVSIYNEKREDSFERILNEFECFYPKLFDKMQSRYPFLSESELHIAMLSFIGFRIKEEAELLGISENTVGKYRSNIRKKAGNNPVSDLV